MPVLYHPEDPQEQDGFLRSMPREREYPRALGGDRRQPRAGEASSRRMPFNLTYPLSWMSGVDEAFVAGWMVRPRWPAVCAPPSSGRVHSAPIRVTSCCV